MGTEGPVPTFSRNFYQLIKFHISIICRDYPNLIKSMKNGNTFFRISRVQGNVLECSAYIRDILANKRELLLAFQSHVDDRSVNFEPTVDDGSSIGTTEIDAFPVG